VAVTSGDTVLQELGTGAVGLHLGIVVALKGGDAVEVAKIVKETARDAPEVSSKVPRAVASSTSNFRAPRGQKRKCEHVETGDKHQEQRWQWRVDNPGRRGAKHHCDEVGNDGRREDDRQPTMSLPNPHIHWKLLSRGLHILRVHQERSSIIFQALPDGSRKLASTPPKRAIGSWMNSTPLVRSFS